MAGLRFGTWKSLAPISIAITLDLYQGSSSFLFLFFSVWGYSMYLNLQERYLKLCAVLLRQVEMARKNKTKQKKTCTVGIRFLEIT